MATVPVNARSVRAKDAVHNQETLALRTAPAQTWRMSTILHRKVYLPGIVCALACAGLTMSVASAAVFNVRDYGATGQKTDDARAAIQKTIEACAASGGGTVLLPRGEYTSGTLHLRSRVRLEIAAGATLFASTNEAVYDFGKIPSKAALLYGENLEDVTITGEGTLDGQAAYEWRDDDVEHTFDHKDRMVAAGKSIRRSFPAGLPQRVIFPHLMFLSGCQRVNVTGLKWLHSPSWTITLYACEQARLEGLYVYTSLQDGVWADGIDLDGCKDIRIERCTVETGDDCVIFISSDVWGPARRCENITVANCRLSSASAGIKFSEGNFAGVRNIVVRDCVLTNVNRGLVFYTIQGGDISDVVVSNLTIHCNRFDWFWAGDGQPFHFRVMRLSEWRRQPISVTEPVPGVMRNITIRDVTAHGKGSSLIYGHGESWLEGLRFENVKLRLSTDPGAAYDAATNALNFRYARNLKLKNVSVHWEQPLLKAWQSALSFTEVQGLELDGFSGRQAWPENERPAVLFNNVTNASVTHATASTGTQIFLKMGPGSRAIRVQGNDFRQAKLPWQSDPSVPTNAVSIGANLLPQ